jgi:Cu(I)/Ag(I) efflux system protein CusF
LVSAIVDDVNAGAGKITLDHEAIPKLSMDAMTMVFRAADAAMLKDVRKGEKVLFSADRVNGQLTVTKVQKAR